MKIAVIEYNAGNIRSVVFALKRLGHAAVISGDAKTIQNADRVIFPGVGEAASTMRYLRARGLGQVITALKQPVLGICLGLQLLCKSSEENSAECLGVFDNAVRRFVSTEDVKLKVPHMGWNGLFELQGPLFAGIPDGAEVYFVHSYYAEISEGTVATCRYIHPFSAALQKRNFFAVQFHPEKSSIIGEQILKNFIGL